jgi:hypothetical protein
MWQLMLDKDFGALVCLPISFAALSPIDSLHIPDKGEVRGHSRTPTPASHTEGGYEARVVYDPAEEQEDQPNFTDLIKRSEYLHFC